MLKRQDQAKVAPFQLKAGKGRANIEKNRVSWCNTALIKAKKRKRDGVVYVDLSNEDRKMVIILHKSLPILADRKQC